jgi:hypothetical protein
MIMSENAVGRPTVFTSDIINKLEQAFALGANDSEACSYAGISRQSYYKQLKTDEEFSNKIKKQKTLLPLKAREELHKLIKQGNSKAILWYLDRVEKRHKAESNTAVNNVIEDLTQTEYDRLLKIKSFSEDELDRLYEYARTLAETSILRKKLAIEGETLISEQTGSSYTNPLYTQMQYVQTRMDKLRDKLFPPVATVETKAKDIREQFFR